MDKNTTPAPEPAPTPRYSDDGKWWWNGTRWVPAPPQPRTPMFVFATREIRIVMALVVIVLTPIFIYFGHQAYQDNRETHDVLCQSFPDANDCY